MQSILRLSSWSCPRVIQATVVFSGLVPGLSHRGDPRPREVLLRRFRGTSLLIDHSLAICTGPLAASGSGIPSHPIKYRLPYERFRNRPFGCNFHQRRMHSPPPQLCSTPSYRPNLDFLLRRTVTTLSGPPQFSATQARSPEPSHPARPLRRAHLPKQRRR
ncbi:hypothetical protein OH77DRAFT_687896 [Trametes cingulata]|nr:hypothetical protein OH77DRAFT_687896 [Trametes cingulata]